MKKLLNEVKILSKGPVGKTVRKRLKEFVNVNRSDTSVWFSELCFCILAANAKGRTAYDIQTALGVQGCISAQPREVLQCIMDHKHRFHNNKAKYIVDARKHVDIKEKIKPKVDREGLKSAREWLVKSVKGIGYKEASHFLRNTGYNDVAILDRHILNILQDHKIIRKPKTLTKQRYLRIEKKFVNVAEAAGMSMGELDLYLWQMKTGEVMK